MMTYQGNKKERWRGGGGQNLRSWGGEDAGEEVINISGSHKIGRLRTLDQLIGAPTQIWQ